MIDSRTRPRGFRPAVAILGAFAAIAAAACTAKDTAADAPRSVSITMERTPCFGRCPVYRLDLDGTGKVVYEGRGFVKDRGRQEATVPAADVQALAKEIEAAGFFTLRDSYPPDATDNASVITSVTIDGKTKRVEHDLSSRAAPESLKALYQRIDDVAGSKRWVGEDVQPRPGEKGGGPDTAARKDTARR
jgi:hypothetical protein